MKHHLKNSGKTAKYLNKLPLMYIVACWANYGVMDYPWSGKWTKNKHTGHMEPLVWYYDDHNGTADEWYLVPIHLVTCSYIIMWTEDESAAHSVANALNIRRNIRSSMEEK